MAKNLKKRRKKVRVFLIIYTPEFVIETPYIPYTDGPLKNYCHNDNYEVIIEKLINNKWKTFKTYERFSKRSKQ